MKWLKLFETCERLTTSEVTSHWMRYFVKEKTSSAAIWFPVSKFEDFLQESHPDFQCCPKRSESFLKKPLEVEFKSKVKVDKGVDGSLGLWNGKSVLRLEFFDTKKDVLGSLFLVGPQSAQRWLKARSTIDMLRFYRQQLIWAQQYESAQKLSFSDDLTQLHNQRYLGVVLDREFALAKREDSALSVLFIDIDYFKSVNDTKGHMFGSQLLVSVGEVIRKCIRASDYGFRYGGDEFVIVLPGVNTDEARFIAERLRRTVAETQFDISGNPLSITVSVGIASFPEHGRTKDEVLRLADKAMYEAKFRKRNTVFVAAS